MAFVAYGAGANAAFPSVWQDRKYPKDIVINGILFDIDTMTPKVGSDVMAHTGNYGVGGVKSWTIMDDDDIYYFGIMQNDHVAGQYVNIMTPNYPYVWRDIKSDGTSYDTAQATIQSGYIIGNTSILARDWLDHPPRTIHLNTTTNEYIMMSTRADNNGTVTFWDASGDYKCFQEGQFVLTGADVGNFIFDADTDYGMLFMKVYNSASLCGMMLEMKTYAQDPSLHSPAASDVELLGLPSTTTPQYIHHLTKSSNGDHYFLTHNGTTVGNNQTADIVRFDNSTGGITVEYNNFAQSTEYRYPMTVPSNVVYHQKTGDTSTSKKICYYQTFKNAGFDQTLGNHELSFIEIDVANNTITRSLCSFSTPDIANADEDLNIYNNSATGPDWISEARIMSASQDINSQKYLFQFIQTNGNPDDDNQDRPYMITKISASNPANHSALTSTSTYGTWDTFLTQSAKVVNNRDKAPWCVAPLNVEHTLMMVYCKYSTHVIKFDTSAETLTEVWMDDSTYFSEVMWLPSGKVITSQYNNSFAQGSSAVDHHAPKPIQVWAQDLIYNVDITTSADYVDYSGSDVSNTLTINAYDASNSRVATDLTLKIIGPAVFDNSTDTKTVTTSASADTTETITINDSGQVEVQVVEIQS